MSENTKSIPQADARKFFIRLMIPMTIISMIYSMQLTPLSVYVGEMGGTAFHVGLIGGINFFVGLIARPFAGYFTDMQGRQKIYMLGAIIYTLSTLGYVFAPNITVLIISRAILGIALCCTTTAQGAIVADLYPDSMTRCFYIMAMLQTVAGMFAPALGQFLANTIGYRFMFMITAAGYLIALFFSLSLTYEKDYPHKWLEGEKPSVPKLSELFEKSAILPAICILLHGIAHISIMSFIAPYGQTLGISNVGLFFTINSVGSFVVSAVLAKITGRRLRNFIFYIGGATFIGTMMCFYFAQNMSWFIMAAVLFSVAYAATQPVLQSIAMAGAPENRKGAASATFQMFWDFGFGAGSVVLGSIAQSQGYKAIYLVSAVLVVLIVLIFVLKLRNIQEEEDPENVKAQAEAAG